MARKVLGNDPFRRGAAAREDAPAPSQAPAVPQPSARPVSPELQLPRGPKLTPVPSTSRPAPGTHGGGSKVKGAVLPKTGPSPQPTRAAPRAPSKSGASPRPHAASPSIAFEATPHAATPSAVPLGSAPRPHPGSPSVPFEATSHAQTPAATPLRSAPRPHPGSPSVPFEATPHGAAPGAVPLGSAPRPHLGSPSVPFEATPHGAAPDSVPLGSAPRYHPGSPSVPFDATPHGAAPAAVPLGSAPRHHPGSPSVPFEPKTHDETPSVRSPPDELRSARVVPKASLPGALKGLWRAVRTASGLPTRSTDVDAWGKDAELARLLRPLAELLYEKYWRVHAEGVEHVPRGPCLLVANHAGALPLDGPVLHLALQRERPDLADARWLLEDQVFHAPFVGLLANRLGAVRASPENALKLLAEGRPVIVFPEGFHGLSKAFSERYQLRRFGRGGYLKIAIRAGVPVVPVAIVGGEESMPLLAKVPGGFLGVEYVPLTVPPLPARWFLRFAPPIDFSGAPEVPEDDLAWVERTNVEVRDQIETMLGDLLARRPRVF